MTALSCWCIASAAGYTLSQTNGSEGDEAHFNSLHLKSTMARASAISRSIADENGTRHRSNQQRRLSMELILKALNRSDLLLGPDHDLYNFGVYTGGGLKGWVEAARAHPGIEFGRIWGFDSFSGLPDSDLARHSPHQARNTQWQAGKAHDELTRTYEIQWRRINTGSHWHHFLWQVKSLRSAPRRTKQR